MTIKQQGGIFGRNPSFNDVDINTASVSGSLTANLIGIGTSPTSGALQIASGLSSTAFLENTSSAYCFVGLKDTTGNLSYFGSANGEFKIQTPGSGYADKLKVSSVGDVTVGLGNLVIGTSGKGIDFSATSGTGTSELFDDYEEGTWTPVVAFGSIAGTGITYSGKYTKIGNTVTIHFQAATTGAVNDLVVASYVGFSGLPFTAASGFNFSGYSTTEDIDKDLGGETQATGAVFYLGPCGSGSFTSLIGATMTYLTS
jgi:hypothetical protein